MERSTLKTFERDRLRLARDLRGWSQSQLAAACDMTPAAVSQFESGATRPAASTRSRLAAELRVPVDFFCHPVAATHEGFFRSLRRTSAADRRRARALGHLARDLACAVQQRLNEPAVTLPAVTLPADRRVDLHASREAIEQAAGHLRAAWHLPPGPISDVLNLVETHGVVAVRLPMQSQDLDAFSLPFPDRPVIVLGADKGDRPRSRFDAAHELGHLVLHGEQIWGLKAVEDQAHWFAAAFLMPAQDIGADLPSRIDWPRLFELKRTWHVSLAALLMRAKTLGIMPPDRYLSALKAASARGWRRTEPVPLGPPEQPRMLNHAVAGLSRTGTTLKDLTRHAGLPFDDVCALLESSRS